MEKFEDYKGLVRGTIKEFFNKDYVLGQYYDFDDLYNEAYVIFNAIKNTEVKEGHKFSTYFKKHLQWKFIELQNKKMKYELETNENVDEIFPCKVYLQKESFFLKNLSEEALELLNLVFDMPESFVNAISNKKCSQYTLIKKYLGISNKKVLSIKKELIENVIC